MKISIIALFLLSVIVTGCSAQKKLTEQQSEKKSKNTMQYNFGNCYDDRETVQKVENIKGKIIKITDSFWALQPDDDSRRFGLCEIPEELKKENLSITFSGEIKKIKPNERMAASPFKVTSLSVISK